MAKRATNETDAVRVAKSIQCDIGETIGPLAGCAFMCAIKMRRMRAFSLAVKETFLKSATALLNCGFMSLVSI